MCKSQVTNLNAQTLHEIYVLIYLTTSKKAYTCFEWFEFCILISLLDLDTMQNMDNQNDAVLEHYKEGVSVLVSKNHFYDREILACC